MAHDDARPPADIRTCPLGEVNLFDPAVLNDPYPYFTRLRDEAPVFRDPKSGIVSVSTYDLIMEVNRQPQLFSNNFGAQLRAGAAAPDAEEIEILKHGWDVPNTMLTADPPAHTRYRKLSGKAFTYKRVEAMGDYVAQVTHDLIDRFIAHGACEFKSAFANHLPMTVIADSLGVPRGDMGDFHLWSEAFIVQLGGVSDRAARLDAMRKIVAFQKYFVERIEEKRLSPSNDIISDLVHADLSEEGDPRKMDHGELLSIMQQLLVAGNETTAHSLTAGIYHLIANPDQMAKLIADPELTSGFVEETLRYLSPTNNMWRVAMADATVGGVEIKKGEMILVRYGAANRDEKQFPEAERFDLTRENARTHLAFGAGIHTCIAAPLARKEMNIAFPIILDRLKNLRLQEGKGSIRYSPNILLRGVLELHVAFDRR